MVAETKPLPRYPQFDDGCFRGNFKEACRTKLTKAHLINLIEDLRRRNEEASDSISDPSGIWEERCLQEIREMVEGMKE